jgi:3-hydroxybutyryl-CoA dehydrogenase
VAEVVWEDHGMAREFRTVGVVGLGTMGAGIVEVFARNGLHVIAAEIDDDAVARGLSHLDTSTSRAVGRGKLTQEDADALLARITTTTSMADLADADLVVEAVPEHLELKTGVFGELDKVCHPDAVLASNTSSLSITELAVRTGRPGRLVGMHFFNPAPVQRLVELVGTVVTEPGIIDDLKAFATTLDKVPVVIGDRAGFIANALLFGYLNHAARMYEQRYASREDLDAAMRYGCGYPMGPLALLDLIGLDTAYEILETMYAESRNLMHAPVPLLKQMITAGLKGRKSGRGFYTYAGRTSSKVVPDAETPDGTVPDDVRCGTSSASAWSAPVRMAAGIVEVFAKAGWTWWCADAATRRWRRRSPSCARHWTRAWCAAGSPRTSATPPSPGSPDDATGGPGRRRPRRRGRRRGVGRQDARCSPRSTRSASRARS